MNISSKRASPWHAGEIALQRSVGVAERMDELGRRTLRDHLLQQHRDFYPQLPFVVLGAVDDAGDAWATVRAGKPGFLHAPDPYRLHIGAPRDAADPADAGMDDGDAVGLLGIELHTRRRNRLNGNVRRTDDGGFDLTVGMSFGNCPQYIQLREFAFARDPSVPAQTPVEWFDRLDDATRATIANADTFFVASYADREDGGRQVDVSHRGGKPGFVRLGDDGVLTVPDFAGNLHFNTLGNFLINPRAGLVFVDFSTGDLLQLTGDAEVITDSPEIAAFQGAERLWRFKPRRIVRRPGALPLRWAFEENGWSPNVFLTGDWQATQERLDAAALAHAWRPLRIVRIVEESTTIRSLHLAPADDAGLPAPRAGQHLPVRVQPPGLAAPVVRTYTLSSAPSDGTYRISVRRQGLVSAYLHGLHEGDVIETRAPAGAFIFDAAERRPAVLLAAGVGITPMLAMLRHAVYEGARTRRLRPIWLFQAARSKAERAFDAEIAALAASAPGSVHVTRLLADAADAREGHDYDFLGRLGIGTLRATLPFDDYDFYLCGPPAFMQSLYDGLRALNVPDARIHAEAFGPASLRRDAPTVSPVHVPSQEPVPVLFVESAKEARWQPGGGTLLDLAESRGLTPEFSCRGGSCGTCRTKVVAGAVAYETPPAFPVDADEALICCAVPAAGEGALQLAL